MSGDLRKYFLYVLFFVVGTFFSTKSLAFTCGLKYYSYDTCTLCGSAGGCTSDDLYCDCSFVSVGVPASCKPVGQVYKCPTPPTPPCVTPGGDCSPPYINCCSADGYYCDTSISPNPKCVCSTTSCDLSKGITCCENQGLSCQNNVCVSCKNTGDDCTSSSDCCDKECAIKFGESVGTCCAPGYFAAYGLCTTTSTPGCNDGGTFVPMGQTCPSNNETCVCDGTGYVCECDSGYTPVLGNLIYNGPLITDLDLLINPVLKILYYGGLGIGLFFIIFSGYNLMTSGGDPNKTQSAKEQLTAAVLGILFILLSSTILRIIIGDIIDI